MTILGDRILRVLLDHPRKSAGNIARMLMGARLITNTPESYAAVKEELGVLAAAGRVKKYGNGKSHQYELVK